MQLSINSEADQEMFVEADQEMFVEAD